MAAPEPHPIQHVSAIKRLLEHYEKGFAFIKELIQNADDALKDSPQPGSLHLQWYRPTAGDGFENPLLCGPALLVINDGPFTKNDRDGLMRMGLGSKAGDSERIGRFGLGMKAVFHVSEAFFFFESSGDQELRELFCPWLPPQYVNWAIDDDHHDWDRMTTVISNSVPDFKNWFAVWIPLRRQDLVTNGNPIVPDYPGDSDGCPENLIQSINHQTPSLGEALIFLRNLERVSFHDGAHSQIFYHRRKDRKVSPDINYYRHQSAENGNLAREWQAKPAWPKVFEITETGERSVADKAKWEASVAISSSKQPGHGSLRIYWTVFLPVGNKPAFEAPIPSLERNLSLFLHGYLFLNEDRTQVYGANDEFKSASETDPKGIKIAWNEALATSPSGLLQLIPTALERAFIGEGLKDHQISTIIACLSRSEWFTIYRKYICQNYSFARILADGTWAWRRFDSRTAQLGFPNFPDLDTESILIALLGSGNLDKVVSVKNGFSLAPCDIELNWDESQLEWLCTLIQQEVLSKHPNARKYLAKLLSELGALATANPMIWEHLTIYEVETITGQKSIVSTKTLQAHSQSRPLLCGGDPALKGSFRDACPHASAWFTVGLVPPGVPVTAFDINTVATMVLSENNLGEPQNRTALIGNLLTGVDQPNIKNAIRYLIHGNAKEHTSNEKLFLTPIDGDTWANVINAVLNHTRGSWRLVTADFAAIINDRQKESLDVKMCNADSFRAICRAAGENVSALGLDPFHDFLLSNLNEGTPYDPDADNKLLRSLKIHRYAESKFTTIEGSVWLAPEAGKEPIDELGPIWRPLCQTAKIVQRSANDAVVLRQTKLFQDRILDPNGIIRLACQQDRPHGFARLILHYLGTIGNPTKETSDLLRTTKWLPLKDKSATSLDNLLWIKDAETELDRLIRYREMSSPVFTRGALDIDFNEKDNAKAWNTIKAYLIPKDDAALENLRSALASNAQLHFGISKIRSVGEWLKAVERCEPEISPAVPLIRGIWTTDGEADATERQSLAFTVFESFAKTWQDENAIRYDTALQSLRRRHCEASAGDSVLILTIFHSYFRAAFQSGRWKHFIEDNQFSLPNKKHEWKSLSALVPPCPGIARAYQVHPDAAECLNIGVSNVGDADAALDVEVAEDDTQSSIILSSFLTALPQLHRKQWGSFVSILGNDSAIRGLSDKLTEDTEGFRSGLIAEDHLLEIIGQKHFRCSQIDGETIEMESLDGGTLNVPVDSDADSFLVPDKSGDLVSWEITGGLHVHRIRLLSPERFASLDSTALQKKTEYTIAQVLDCAFGHSSGTVSEFLDKVIEIQERSLGVAQQKILVGAEVHLQQLGWRQIENRGLADAFKHLDCSKNAEAQAREQERIGHASKAEIIKNRENANFNRDEGLRIMEKLLSSNEELQRALAQAMRQKIADQGYMVDSIPFELFQNADDALSERGSIEGIPQIFVAEFTAREARFAHWGRPINDPGGSGGEAVESHRHDLVKMILLNGSDKSFESTPVTGKFGLGFKSIFLICQTPKIVSRSLAFKVLGATYPQRLSSLEESSLRQWLELQLPQRRDGTAYELPLRSGVGTFHDLFCNLASFLPVFSRCIREIRVSGVTVRNFHWNPSRIDAGEGWELCMGDAGSVGRLIHLKCGDVSWLFGMDQNGIRRLNDIPCIWATAPLHSTGEVGFAINGPFDPDPGRTELGKGEAAKSRNAALFHDASEGLRQFFKWCFECENLCGTLGMTEDSTDSFWESLWNLVSGLPSSENDSSARSRVARCAWPREGGGGYRGAAQALPIIPNGLPGNLATRTSISHMRFQTSCFLESHQGHQLLEALAEWPEWEEMEAELDVSAANVVTGAVAAVLRRQVLEFEIEVIQLPFVLRRLAGRAGRVTAELSRRLGEFLIPTIWSSGYNWPRQEKEDLEQFLADLSFETDSGEWLIPRSLLIVHGTGVESVRAAFAPPARQLNSKYLSNSALAFFRLCRGEMDVSSDEMADWIKDALNRPSRERITASLKFLASTSDDLTSKTAGLLCLGTRTDLMARPEFADLSPEDQYRVVNAFKLADISRDRLVGTPPLEVFPTPIHTPVSIPPITLEDVLDCWRGHEDDAVQQFTVSGIYRDLVFPNVAEDVELGSLFSEADSINSKEIWYRLLCLGCCMSIPLGPDPSTRILPFWRERLKDEFWAATIPTNLDEVSSIRYDQRLDAFFEKIIHQNFRNENASGEGAEFWRRVFYDFRKMHFYVFKNDLPGVLLQLARSNEVEGSALIHFLRSGMIPASMQAPGFEAWSGVIGQSMSAPLLFVMRELRRLKVLPLDRFDQACFYMNSPARRVAHDLAWITDQQMRNYSFGNLVSISEKAFNKIRQSEHSDALLPYFDLPLQWYAHQNWL